MQVSWTAKKTNECVLKICTSVKTFTHVHKTPIHSLSWECCNETFQCLISRCPSFHCNGKIIFIYFCLELGAPGLCPTCPPHCYATAVRPSVCPVDRQQQRRPASLLLRSCVGRGQQISIDSWCCRTTCEPRRFWSDRKKPGGPKRLVFIGY